MNLRTLKLYWEYQPTGTVLVPIGLIVCAWLILNFVRLKRLGQTTSLTKATLSIIVTLVILGMIYTVVAPVCFTAVYVAQRVPYKIALRSLAPSLEMYASDHDNRLPPNSGWRTSSEPFLPTVDQGSVDRVFPPGSVAIARAANSADWQEFTSSGKILLSEYMSKDPSAVILDPNLIPSGNHDGEVCVAATPHYPQFKSVGEVKSLLFPSGQAH